MGSIEPLLAGVVPVDDSHAVCVRRWLRAFSSRRHFARRLENQTLTSVAVHERAEVKERLPECDSLVS